MGVPFDTLNKAWCVAKATTDSNADCVGAISWQVVAGKLVKTSQKKSILEKNVQVV